jgi:hypothetical protein
MPIINKCFLRLQCPVRKPVTMRRLFLLSLVSCADIFGAICGSICFICLHPRVLLQCCYCIFRVSSKILPLYQLVGIGSMGSGPIGFL